MNHNNQCSSKGCFSDSVYSKPSNEPVSYITGLQIAIDSRVKNNQILTDVPANALDAV